MDADSIINIFYASLRMATPLLLVALGEMVAERAGVLNLGQEGLLLMGAVSAFAIVASGHGYVAGFAGAMLVDALLAAIFGFFVINLCTNQVATGLALSIFGAGLSALVGLPYIGFGIDGLKALPIPYLSDIFIFGKVLFSHELPVYLAYALVPIMYCFFKYSRLGLKIKAVGENPEAAHALGIRVYLLRYLAVIFGGALSGAGGAYLSLVYTPMWSQGMSQGMGWIALALVVFASWRAERILLGALLFGSFNMIALLLQGSQYPISPNLMATLPYLATIMVLILISRKNQQSPQALGMAYRPMH